MVLETRREVGYNRTDVCVYNAKEGKVFLVRMLSLSRHVAEVL